MTTAAAPHAPVRVSSPPARPTVLYDGRCALCTGSAERIRALDHARVFDLLSLHEPEVARRFPEIELAAVLEEMHVVEPTGAIVRGHEAIRAILERLPRLRWLALFWLVPGFDHLARAGYGLLARNRYRFNRHATCDTGACTVPRHRHRAAAQ